MVLEIIADGLYNRIKPEKEAIVEAFPPVTYSFNPADLEKLRAFKRTSAKNRFCTTNIHSEQVEVNDKRHTKDTVSANAVVDPDEHDKPVQVQLSRTLLTTMMGMMTLTIENRTSCTT